MTMNDEAKREPDTREQLQRGLAFLKRATRFWHVPLLALVAGAVAFGIFNLVRTPKYRSETVILYIERGGAGTADSSQAERTANVRLRELLLSRPTLERMIKSFDLYPDVRRRYGMGDALEELKKHVDFRAPGGDTFSIAFVGESPREAQSVTSELARSVIDGDSQLRKQHAKVALDFLASEKKTMETQLRDAEQKLAAFMAQHPRLALDATPLANGAAIRASLGVTPAPAPPGTPPRVTWAPGAAAAAKPAGAAKAGAPAAAPAPAMAAVPVAPINNAEEARARAALAAAREHLNEQLSRYTPAHPDVRAAEAAVARANERLLSLSAGAPPAAAPAAAAPAAPAPATAPAPASGRAPAPRPRAVAVPAPVAVGAAAPASPDHDLVDLETQWLQLTRAVTEARQRQDQIEAQLFRADMQADSAAVGHGVHVSVIDPAYLPERPEPPGRTTIAAIFAAVALALGALLTLILAALDERMFLPRDAEGVAEILAEVPSPGSRRAHVAA